jgi:isopenicillin-N N-acyltransferase like protein
MSKVVTPHTIPVLQLEGSYRDVGRQIGEACADVIGRAVAFDVELPAGRTRDEQLTLASRYRDLTAAAMPWVIEELDGAAEGAQVEPLALFACSVEEIWYESRTQGGGAAIDGRCSDVVATSPATADGHVLVGHNNDLSPHYRDELVAIERRVPGDPAIFTIGNGIWISVGWNDAGLSLTGNELAPNDERIGVPRELQVRAMLRDTSLDAMVGTALRHDRASSYNNVLASSNGDVVNVEGSATSVEMTEPDEHGHLVHTNHYVCDAMLPYEGDPEYARRSAVRYARAEELLAAQPDGSMTEERMREILSDHEHAPDSLCRHAHGDPGDSVTCFWCVTDVTDMRITFGRGNPCDSVEQEFAFAT